MEGWNIGPEEEVAGYGLDDLEKYDEFNSEDEIREFITGTGRYSDRNSFAYTPVDRGLQMEEGFLNPFRCHRCAEEGQDDNIRHISYSSETKSYRRGYDREVLTDILYCSEHSDVYMMKQATRYTETG